VRTALALLPTPIHSLAVRLKPKSGKPGELLDYEGVSKDGIIKKVMELLPAIKLAAS